MAGLGVWCMLLAIVSSISCISSMSIDVPDIPFEVVVPEDDVSMHHIQTIPYLIWGGKATSPCITLLGTEILDHAGGIIGRKSAKNMKIWTRTRGKHVFMISKPFLDQTKICQEMKQNSLQELTPPSRIMSYCSQDRRQTSQRNSDSASK